VGGGGVHSLFGRASWGVGVYGCLGLQATVALAKRVLGFFVCFER
jgi:hypothetical protein